MPRVRPDHLAAAIAKASAMSMAEKEAEFDVIYQEQPNLLASVIVQQTMGNSLEQMEVLLNILLVIHLSLQEAGVVMATVSEEEQERQLRRLTEGVQFAHSLDDHSLTVVLNQMIEDHPEKWLFAFAFDEMMKAGFPQLKQECSKYLIMCGLNLVNCLK